MYQKYQFVFFLIIEGTKNHYIRNIAYIRIFIVKLKYYILHENYAFCHNLCYLIIELMIHRKVSLRHSISRGSYTIEPYNELEIFSLHLINSNFKKYCSTTRSKGGYVDDRDGCSIFVTFLDVRWMSEKKVECNSDCQTVAVTKISNLPSIHSVYNIRHQHHSRFKVLPLSFSEHL